MRRPCGTSKHKKRVGVIAHALFYSRLMLSEMSARALLASMS